ncbi:MAG: aldehyde dehydrogenase family protein, partial [Bdellovibrionota bacterium]|nr:aldehyde dehydrogenase family protein [Bdellovibrionota bacterium]
MFQGNYVDGQFLIPSRTDETWTVVSPGDLSDTIGELSSSYTDVDKAVDAAKSSFKSWSALSIEERKSYLLKLKEVYLKHKEEIATCISRETGKAYWETLGEAGALAGKIDITINASLSLIEEQAVTDALPGVTGRIKYKPRGVLAVLGPFNFPGHLPNGHLVPALLTGNTVVFKPSEMTPFTGQILARCIHEAGFPKGVFNLVQGGGEVGRR